MSAAGTSACMLDIPVYDAFGSRANYSVVWVSAERNDSINLLSARPSEVRKVADSRLILDRSLLRRVLVVTLEDRNGARVRHPVLLMQCPQRVSVRIGSNETGGDLAFSTLEGRLTGCGFAGDWWIRAINMFGSPTAPASLEAGVEPDGSFALSGHMAGERHLLVVGRDRFPVKSIGVNVVVGKPNDIGIVDVSGNCPP